MPVWVCLCCRLRDVVSCAWGVKRLSPAEFCHSLSFLSQGFRKPHSLRHDSSDAVGGGGLLAGCRVLA